MRKLLIGVPVALVAVALVATVALAGRPADSWSFTAPLSGGEEVPANSSLARGVAIFHVNDDGTSMSYKLIAANIENVIMAHIHLAPEGVNGPVVVWLYPEDGPPPATAGAGRHDGVLATGTITADDLVGPLGGMSMEDLLDEITSGNAYVNVHTNDGIGDPGSGPGDLPGGEIRGQID